MQDESSRLAAWSRAVRDSSLKRLRLVPEGQANWRPVPDAMSFAGVAQHILEADLWLFKKLEFPTIPAMKVSNNVPALATYQEYLDILLDLKRTGNERSGLIQSLTREQFAQKIPDERFAGDVSVWWVLVRGNLDHEAHHRGQLAAYLRIAHIVTT